MLLLSRKLGEQIRIGDGIAITVVNIRGGRVRFGITAPRDVPIHRTEIADPFTNSGSAEVPESLDDETSDVRIPKQYCTRITKGERHDHSNWSDFRSPDEISSTTAKSSTSTRHHCSPSRSGISCSVG